MLVLIRNRGCDDTTTGIVEFKDERELNNFIEIIINLNNNSNYRCMPTIDLYEIKQEDLVLLDEAELKNKDEDIDIDIDDLDIVEFKNKKYIPASYLSLGYGSWYDYEKSENDLIIKYKINNNVGF